MTAARSARACRLESLAVRGSAWTTSSGSIVMASTACAEQLAGVTGTASTVVSAPRSLSDVWIAAASVPPEPHLTWAVHSWLGLDVWRATAVIR